MVFVVLTKQFSPLQSADNKIDIPQTSRLTKATLKSHMLFTAPYKDSKGNMWFGTESRGVCKYDGKTFTWLDNEELGLAVRSIFEDSKGNIWIGNNGNGLFRYDGKTLTNFTKEQHLENPDFQTTLEGKKEHLPGYGQLPKTKNNLWIGTIDADAYGSMIAKH